MRTTLVGLAFFLSGAAALVYQVVWQRILALHSGLGIFSVALIVAAFMAGLGLGSHVGGLLSARVDPRRALRVFAALEVAVGIFAAVSVRFYHDWLYDHAAWLSPRPGPSSGSGGWRAQSWPAAAGTSWPGWRLCWRERGRLPLPPGPPPATMALPRPPAADPSACGWRSMP